MTQSRSDKYDQAEIDRQSALDFLRERPGSAMRQLMWHFQDKTASRVSQLLNRMESMGEVRRVKGGAKSFGGPCAAWYACVETTITAAEVRAVIADNLKGTGEGRRIVRGRVIPAPRLFGGL